MKTFAYRAFDPSGRPRKGLIEALDIKRAREALSAEGLLPETVAPLDSGPEGRAGRWPRRFPLRDRTLFYRELVALLQAGLPLAGALDMLIQSPDLEAHRAILASLRDQIQEGAPLSAALARAAPSVSDTEQAALAAGEKAASLDAVLDRLAAFLDEQADLRDRLTAALIYPALVFLVAVGIAVGLLGFGIPRLTALLAEETGGSLPWLTCALMGLGSLTVRWGLPLLAAAAAAVWLWHRRLAGDEEQARAFDRRLFRLPGIGRGYALLAALRFARTLALLVHGGIPLVDGLPLAGRATGSRWLAHAVAEEAGAVRHGRSLADLARRIAPLAVLTGWIQVGEAGGALAPLLDSAADRLQRQWERFLARRMNLVEPALILAIGAFVLLVVLAVLLPILTLNRRLA